MNRPSAEPDPMARFAEAVDRMNRNLDSWAPFFQRLSQAETMRFLALGQSTDLNSAAVRSIIQARRLRDEYFWPAMSESAWTLMLEMYAASLTGECRDLTGLSQAAGIQVDDTARYVEALEGRGLVFRPGQPPAPYQTGAVRLTDEGGDRMRAYLLASLELSPWVV